jgi:acetyltransferase-like isoleucine patch superfamily enzyme
MMRGDRTKLRSFLKIFVILNYKICTIVPGLYGGYLRKKGVAVGEGTEFMGLPIIDMTRPYMIEIGRNCVFSADVTLLTHGFDFCVLREKYGEVLGSSGKVVIEDNVFVGARTVIMKGTRIGKDSIIGAGSIVTHDIPPSSVAAGNPCRVIMTLDQYYEKRKKLYVEEAKAYALEIYRKTGKIPRRTDFLDEFPLFLDRSEKLDLLDRSQLGSAIGRFRESKPTYGSLAEFLVAAGIPASKIKAKEKT